ncbi:TPA: hypothetical protein ACH3X1_003430 [Trebouxia sp. C0004]
MACESGGRQIMYRWCCTVPSVSQVLLAWGGAEMLFYVFQRHRYTAVTARQVNTIDHNSVEDVMSRFLTLGGYFAIQDFLSGWFHGAPFDQIYRENCVAFVAYAFYNRDYDDLPARAQEATQRTIDTVEKHHNVQFPPGTNANIGFMAHSWEPLRTLHKPLLVYVISEIWGVCMHLFFCCVGFKRVQQGSISFWIKQPATQTADVPNISEVGDDPLGETAVRGMSSTRPIVFLHGVGWGLFPYIRFLQMLFNQASAHPIILMEFGFISLRLCWRAGEVDDAAHAVAHFVRQHGWSQACIVGHSYGTFVASLICQMHPDMVQSLMLIDPVCLMTCCPQLLHSFIYKVPTWSYKLLTTPTGFMDLLRFIFSRDLMVAETFCRKFCWHSVMLWPQDMPKATTVVFAQNDSLVPLDLAVAQLKASCLDVKLIVHPTATHGGFLLDHLFQLRLAGEITELANTKASKAEVQTSVSTGSSSDET